MEEPHELGGGRCGELGEIERVELAVEAGELEGGVVWVQGVGAEVEEDWGVGGFVGEVFVGGALLGVGPFCSVLELDKVDRSNKTKDVYHGCQN